jgi:methylenetetrahydrofolate dehydrogenase (NADP+) / methenyltetrahydrofolate cyclohydrolase
MEINGKELAREIIEKLKEEREDFDKLILAIFLIGETEEKKKFLQEKEKVAKELNVELRVYNIDKEKVKRRKIRKFISQVVKHKTINGALIQLPLDKNLPKQYLLNAIPPEKDVDCLSSRSLGKFYTDQSLIRPTSVEVVDFLKRKFDFDFVGKVVVMVGYGNLIGKPLTHYFARENATLIILNENTKEPEKYFVEGDYIVSGAGVPFLVNNCKNGAIIIDFGTTFMEGKIFGDVDIEKIKNKAKFYTPTPGGTGPITVAMLFHNLFKLAKMQK